MKGLNQRSLLKYFTGLENPRIERTKQHLLSDIVSLTVCALGVGAEGREKTEDFGRDKFN